MSAYAIRAGMRSLVFVPAGKSPRRIGAGSGIRRDGDRARRKFRSGVSSSAVIDPRNESLSGELAQSVSSPGPEDHHLRDSGATRLARAGLLVVPGGNLGNVSAMGKGLCELRRLGFIEKLPRLVVTQAEGANPFCRMLAAAPQIDAGRRAAHGGHRDPHRQSRQLEKSAEGIRATNGLCESLSG